MIDHCQIGEQGIKRLIQNVKYVNTLDELHLINMSLNINTSMKLDDLCGLNNLKHLNLSNNNIYTFEEIGAFILKSQRLESIDLTGNQIKFSK